MPMNREERKGRAMYETHSKGHKITSEDIPITSVVMGHNIRCYGRDEATFLK